MAEHQIATLLEPRGHQLPLGKALIGLVHHLKPLGIVYVTAVGVYLAGRWQLAAGSLGKVVPDSWRRSSSETGTRTTKSYYDLLGVTAAASPEEIKTAFRKLAKASHPDLNTADPSAARRFTRISKAYEVLVDPELRSLYDAHLRRVRDAQGADPGRLRMVAATAMLASGALVGTVSFLIIALFDRETMPPPSEQAPAPLTIAASPERPIGLPEQRAADGQGPVLAASRLSPSRGEQERAGLARTSHRADFRPATALAANRSRSATKIAATSRCGRQKGGPGRSCL